MGRKSKIEVGSWHGMWLVIDIAGVEQTGSNRKALCKCGNCGHQKLVFVNNLLSGMSSRCTYCRDRRSPNVDRFGHPKVQNIKVGTVIGSLTITNVLPGRTRRTVEAKCLCGNTITRRADVILRDEFPTCHSCSKNHTLYLWGKRDEPAFDLMQEFADGRESRFFDMTASPPQEHVTEGYKRWAMQNEAAQ